MDRVTFVIVLALLVVSTLVVGLNIQQVKAVPRTWTVDDDGPADFDIIQAAINAASNGDTILVKKGVYYENVVVSKSLSLRGESATYTIIDGISAGNAMQVTANRVNVAGFTMTAGYCGVYLLDAQQCNVSQNIIRGNTVGIELDDAPNNLISKNNITDNDYDSDAIAIYFSDNVSISGNIITNSGWGIDVFDSDNNNIMESTIAGNQFDGVQLYDSDNTRIIGNVVGGSWEYGIEISSCDNDVISGNYISDESDGISGSMGLGLLHAANNTVYGNTFDIIMGGIACISGSSIPALPSIVYHNNFLVGYYKGGPAFSDYLNIWDNGYPSGGNYYYDAYEPYNFVDVKSGPDQNLPGADGIADTPCNEDRYPLMSPWPVFADGFESGSFKAWNGTRVSSGETATVQSSTRHHGSYGGRFASNGGAGTEFAYCYGAIGDLGIGIVGYIHDFFARGYFYVSQSGIVENNDRFYLIILNAGSSKVAYAGWRRTAGVVKWTLLIRDGMSYVSVYSSTTPLLNRWYSVELHWKEDAVLGMGELWVDGALVCSITSKNTAALGRVGQVCFGLPEVYSCASTITYCDCAKISGSYIGPET